MSNPWETEVGKKVWKNQTAFFTYLRGCLRKAWSKSPIKHELIKAKRKQIKNPNPNGKKPTVWGFTCEMCKNDFVMAECQVDHINPAGKLNNKEDIQGFTERLLWVTEDDLRLVCKGCNSALSLADKQGISYEEAILVKKAIAMEKELTVKQIKELLTKHNLPCDNAKDRRKGLIEVNKGGTK